MGAKHSPKKPIPMRPRSAGSAHRDRVAADASAIGDIDCGTYTVVDDRVKPRRAVPIGIGAAIVEVAIRLAVDTVTGRTSEPR